MAIILKNLSNMYKSVILIFCTAILFLTAFSQHSQSDYSFDTPQDTKTLSKLTLWATQYYIPKFQSGGKIPIVLADGKPSGLYADTCDFCKASLEGTAFVVDSAGNVLTINYATRGEKSFVDCRKCKTYSNSTMEVEQWGKVLWTKSEGFGDGVQNYKLIPYRTIAVDKTKIPYSTVIFIPKARGQTIVLPNGEKVLHDGYFFAGDTGTAIKENHIDIFTGISAENPFSEVIQSKPEKTFTAYIVKDVMIIQSLTKLHQK
jgi:3D (Asp-Asp-Asp) domain-containing protein